MNDELKKAMEVREEFLNEHPELKPFQAKIDKVLDNATDRQAALQAILGQYVTLLQVEFKLLDRLLDEFKRKN